LDHFADVGKMVDNGSAGRHPITTGIGNSQCPSTMIILEKHDRPDGSLRFIVARADDGDISLGFDTYPSHTHGDILASLSGLPMDEAVRQYVDKLLAGRSFIVIARVDNVIRDVWVTDDPRPDKYKPENETIEFRFWDGRGAPPSD
jgi:hypothetical protein